MKAFILLVMTITCFGCASRQACVCPATASQMKAEIDRAMHQSAKDWTDDDLDAFMRAFHNSPDTRFVTPGGITMGWDAIRERYRGSIDKSNLWFTHIDVTPLTPDTALVFAQFHNKMNADGAYSTGLTSLLMKKVDGNWVIVHDHSSGLPEGYER